MTPIQTGRKILRHGVFQRTMRRYHSLAAKFFPDFPDRETTSVAGNASGSGDGVYRFEMIKATIGSAIPAWFGTHQILLSK